MSLAPEQPTGEAPKRYPKRERKPPKRFVHEEFPQEEKEKGDDDYSDVEDMDIEEEIKKNQYDDADGNEYDMEWCAEEGEVENTEEDDDEVEEEEEEEDDEITEEEDDVDIAYASEESENEFNISDDEIDEEQQPIPQEETQQITQEVIDISTPCTDAPIGDSPSAEQ